MCGLLIHYLLLFLADLLLTYLRDITGYSECSVCVHCCEVWLLVVVYKCTVCIVQHFDDMSDAL